MDIDLLSNMLGDLLRQRESVSLPGVGVFVSEQAPATFSDKGYTINPPFRKVTFRQREGGDEALVDYYAETASLDKEAARGVLKEFLEGMVEVLKDKKVIIFPGLGLLRATKENHFFFVPNEEDNLNSENFALPSISLKSREIQADVKPSEVKEPAPKAPVARKKTEIKRKKHTFLKICGVMILALAVAAAVLRILGNFYPELLDGVLYDEEELSIIYDR